MANLSRGRGEHERDRLSSRHHSPNMEDYLEAIRTLSDEHGTVRVTQLSEALHVSKPSVTSAVSRLSSEGLVHHERYGTVELTNKGKIVADDVWKRHEALWVFLTEILGVSEETAENDACRLEHYLSPDTSRRLADFVQVVRGRIRDPATWLEPLSGRADYDMQEGN